MPSTGETLQIPTIQRLGSMKDELGIVFVQYFGMLQLRKTSCSCDALGDDIYSKHAVVLPLWDGLIFLTAPTNFVKSADVEIMTYREEKICRNKWKPNQNMIAHKLLLVKRTSVPLWTLLIND